MKNRLFQVGVGVGVKKSKKLGRHHVAQKKWKFFKYLGSNYNFLNSTSFQVRVSVS